MKTENTQADIYAARMSDQATCGEELATRISGTLYALRLVVAEAVEMNGETSAEQRNAIADALHATLDGAEALVARYNEEMAAI